MTRSDAQWSETEREVTRGQEEVEYFWTPEEAILTTSTVIVKKLDEETGEVVDVEKVIYFDKKGNRVKRFGFHRFRHSLSSFLTAKKKVDPKMAQTALRQSNAVFTMNRYTQTDNDELLAAQDMMLDAIFDAETGAVQ